jgi:hypothetical protein
VAEEEGREAHDEEAGIEASDEAAYEENGDEERDLLSKSALPNTKAKETNQTWDQQEQAKSTKDFHANQKTSV